MENKGIDPEILLQPQTNAEKIINFFNRGVAAKELIERLAALDSKVKLISGGEIEMTLEDVGRYIKDEARFVKKSYPNDARYSDHIERMRSRALGMEKNLEEKNYAGVIKPMMDLAAKEWKSADLADKRISHMTEEEKEQARIQYKENVEKEKEISKRERETGKKEDHGIPSGMLEVGGDLRRQESQAFLAYAIVLAKEALKKKQL